MKTFRASDVMTSTVITVDAEMSVVEAARRMLQSKVSGLPVVDWQGNLVGMITEGDLMRRAEIGTERHHGRWFELLLGPGRGAEEYAAAHARKVSEVMTESVVSVAADTPVEEVVALMERHHIKRVPVLLGSRLVGVVSRANLLAALVDVTPRPAYESAGDSEICDAILREIDRQRWAPRATVNVAVKDGVVELRGTIMDERERAALRIVVENVAGVKSIVDHLIWVEPFSGMVIEPREAEPAKRTTN